MSKCQCLGRGRHKEFDAEEAYARLNKKYTKLADIVIRYMSEAKLKRPVRAKKALEMAETLATVVGGDLTHDFAECCYVVGSGGACTGVLIHPRVVLTARHCGFIQMVGLRATVVNDPNAEKITVFDSRSSPNSDLQVVILDKAAQTAPGRLARTTEINQANNITVVGFGDSEFGSGQKRALSGIPILSNPGGSEFITGGGACRGDSGGPAYIIVGGNRKLAGIHSRHMGNSCDDGGVYTRIDTQLGFINQVVAPLGIHF